MAAPLTRGRGFLEWQVEGARGQSITSRSSAGPETAVCPFPRRYTIVHSVQKRTPVHMPRTLKAGEAWLKAPRL